jgi:hypothetical protein
MTQKKPAPGAANSKNGGQVHETRLGDDSASILLLLGKLPPAGHSRQLLAFWLERHALERQLELQHRAGALVAAHPLCPLAVSLQVDRLTMRIDAINERLLGRFSAIRQQGCGRDW